MSPFQQKILDILNGPDIDPNPKPSLKRWQRRPHITTLRRIKCVETDVVYKSVGTAATIYGVYPGLITFAILNNRKVKKLGLTFVYLDE